MTPRATILALIQYFFMKKNTHPKYYEEASFVCACGNTFKVGSTKPEVRIELCNLCHPFYTGKQKFVDTARRVEKFQDKIAKTKAAAVGRKGKKVKHAARTAKKTPKVVTEGKEEKK